MHGGGLFRTLRYSIPLEQVDGGPLKCASLLGHSGCAGQMRFRFGQCLAESLENSELTDATTLGLFPFLHPSRAQLSLDLFD